MEGKNTYGFITFKGGKEMKVLKRIFIIIPLLLLFTISTFTLIIPLFYWVFTGEDWLDLRDEILWLNN